MDSGLDCGLKFGLDIALLDDDHFQPLFLIQGKVRLGEVDVVIFELSRKDLVTTEGWMVVVFYVYDLELREPARDGGLTMFRRILDAS